MEVGKVFARAHTHSYGLWLNKIIIITIFVEFLSENAPIYFYSEFYEQFYRNEQQSSF